jgi:Flp pilus assembly pilin Flp
MKFSRNQKGQAMTEYILLVALIAIAVVVAVKYFGTKTKEGFNKSADTVSGQVDQANKDANKAK